MTETVVLDRGSGIYLLNRASIARSNEDLGTDFAASITDGWDVDKSSPFVTWIAGNFVEADKPNSNKQFWTAADLELSDYSIKYSPVNMLHRFRTPVGFFAATRQVKPKPLRAVTSAEAAGKSSSPLTIQVLGGLWSHIFPFEAAQVEAANDSGQLFWSMECRGTHLTCAGDSGCGETFEYMAVDTHCEHLQERSSIRHIVNPTFRGGALLVPPTQPGWKGASAGIVSDAVMQEAASFAERNEAAYKAFQEDGVTMTASAWEQLMSQLLVSTKP